MPRDLRPRSRTLLDGPDRSPARAMMKAVGYTNDDLSKPQVGVAHCWIAKDGTERWRSDLGGKVSASPTLSGSTIYLPNETGTLFVFRADPSKFTLLGKNKLKIPIEPEMFTQTSRFLEFIRNDPWRLREVSGRFLLGSHYLERMIKKRVRDLRLPILLFSAGKDRIIDNQAVLDALSALASQIQKSQL